MVSAVGFKPAFQGIFTYHVLQVDDDDAEDMVIHFENSYKFIKEAHDAGQISPLKSLLNIIVELLFPGGKVLVHW